MVVEPMNFCLVISCVIYQQLPSLCERVCAFDSHGVSGHLIFAKTTLVYGAASIAVFSTPQVFVGEHSCVPIAVGARYCHNIFHPPPVYFFGSRYLTHALSSWMETLYNTVCA